MSMKIEIEISDHYAATLSRWASVSRTLSTARIAAGEAAEAKHVSEADAEMYHHCKAELAELVPALDELHRVARQAMWNIKNRARAVEALEQTTVEQRAEALKIVYSTVNPLFHSYYDRIIAALGIPASLWPEAVIDWLKTLDTVSCLPRRAEDA
jgi:proline dehydrogenase